jgi:glyoxylase-like metal-dependent hydrolase (beta-lactamase superfamily II)
MAVKAITAGVYMVPLGFVNAFLLIGGGNELTLIDTGTPGSSHKILQAVADLRRDPNDVRRILLTHCHADHTGSLAELKRLTGATVYMHLLDAALVRKGQAGRPIHLAPGFLDVPFQAVRGGGQPPQVAPVETDVELHGGQEVDGVPGLLALHTPGHTAGHLAFLWQRAGGVLFLGDAAVNMLGLERISIYEDRDAHERSLARIAALPFQTACFAHGSPITSDAAARFARWASR